MKPFILCSSLLISLIGLGQSKLAGIKVESFAKKSSESSWRYTYVITVPDWAQKEGHRINSFHADLPFEIRHGETQSGYSKSSSNWAFELNLVRPLFKGLDSEAPNLSHFSFSPIRGTPARPKLTFIIESVFAPTIHQGQVGLEDYSTFDANLLVPRGLLTSVETKRPLELTSLEAPQEDDGPSFINLTGHFPHMATDYFVYLRRADGTIMGTFNQFDVATNNPNTEKGPTITDKKLQLSFQFLSRDFEQALLTVTTGNSSFYFPTPQHDYWFRPNRPIRIWASDKRQLRQLNQSVDSNYSLLEKLGHAKHQIDAGKASSAFGALKLAPLNCPRQTSLKFVAASELQVIDLDLTTTEFFDARSCLTQLVSLANRAIASRFKGVSPAEKLKLTEGPDHPGEFALTLPGHFLALEMLNP